MTHEDWRVNLRAQIRAQERADRNRWAAMLTLAALVAVFGAAALVASMYLR